MTNINLQLDMWDNKLKHEPTQAFPAKRFFCSFYCLAAETFELLVKKTVNARYKRV